MATPGVLAIPRIKFGIPGTLFPYHRWQPPGRVVLNLFLGRENTYWKGEKRREKERTGVQWREERREKREHTVRRCSSEKLRRFSEMALMAGLREKARSLRVKNSRRSIWYADFVEKNGKTKRRKAKALVADTISKSFV